MLTEPTYRGPTDASINNTPQGDALIASNQAQAASLGINLPGPGYIPTVGSTSTGYVTPKPLSDVGPAPYTQKVDAQGWGLPQDTAAPTSIGTPAAGTGTTTSTTGTNAVGAQLDQATVPDASVVCGEAPVVAQEQP